MSYKVTQRGILMASDRLSVRISEDLGQQLQALAKSTGKSESELAREALEKYCVKKSTGLSCFDLAKKAGLIGCVEGGPDDLSVNPKHMKGFGRE
jgi:hypothetical protein